jgi:hypothetical protein
MNDCKRTVRGHDEDSLDLERMIEGLKHLDAKFLVRLRGKIRLRLQEIGKEQSPVYWITGPAPLGGSRSRSANTTVKPGPG